MDGWLWLIQWIATSVGPSVVPILWILLSEEPLHFLCSGWLGLLAWRLSFFILPAYSGPRWTRALGISIWRGFVLLAASLVVHCWSDYSGQQFIPAAVR